MEFPITKYPVAENFAALSEIPKPPSMVYVRGNLPPDDLRTLAVVGSRDYTNYGKQVVEHLIGGLRGYPVAVISGLALGIDALAHRSALDAGLYTLSVPGSGLDDSVLYPRTNYSLAKKILESGGGLLSEFEPTFKATPWSFPKRNRIMVGLSQAVLLIEAGEKSGTLITARLTSEYNRDLLAVPGNIFSNNSKGTHQFIKLGAMPITSPEDILFALNIDTEKVENSPTKNGPKNVSKEVQSVLEKLTEPTGRDELIRSLQFPEDQILTLLMSMELDGYIEEQNGVIYKIF